MEDCDGQAPWGGRHTVIRPVLPLRVCLGDQSPSLVLEGPTVQKEGEKSPSIRCQLMATAGLYR